MDCVGSIWRVVHQKNLPLVSYPRPPKWRPPNSKDIGGGTWALRRRTPSLGETRPSDRDYQYWEIRYSFA